MTNFVEITVVAKYRFPIEKMSYQGMAGLFDEADELNHAAVAQYEKESAIDDPETFFCNCDINEDNITVAIIHEPAPGEHPVGGTK